MVVVNANTSYSAQLSIVT